MFKAIQEDDLELVKYYLRMGIDPNYQHPEYMALPLSESIRYKNIEITKALLEYGAKTDLIEMESRKTPSQLANIKGDNATVELLKSHI